MKEKQLNKILFIILIFSMIFGISSIFLSREEKTSQKGIDSCILNTKYKDTVKKIFIENDDESIEIEKFGSIWIITQNTMSALADQKTIESMMEHFQKIRRMYKISDSYINIYSDNSDNLVSFKVSFLDKNNDTLSKTIFFSADRLTQRIFLSSDKNSILYETQDDFSHFLNTDMNFWTDGKMFPEIFDPVEIYCAAGNEKIIFMESDKKFKEISYELLNLRHGQIAKNFTPAQKPILEVSIQDGNGRLEKLQVFVENEEYLLQKKLSPSSAFDSDETAFGFMTENVFFEISEWTFKKLHSLFI